MSPRRRGVAIADIDLSKLGPDSPLHALAAKQRRAPKRDLEHPEQVTFFAWCRAYETTYPPLASIFAVPNMAGFYGSREQRLRAGARAKAEGRKKGVPDVFWPHARGPFHGLFIELKAEHYATAEQRDWFGRLEAEGFHTAVARRFEQARDLVLAYVELGAFRPGRADR